MAYNPYLTKEKDIQTAYVDPKTGNISIVGGGGGDKTDYLKKTGDEFISKGYVPITDPNIISQLQQGVRNTSTFENTQQWQDWLAQNASLVTPLSQAEIDAAKARLQQYEAYEQYSKPVTTPVPLGMPTSSSSGGGSSKRELAETQIQRELAETQIQRELAEMERRQRELAEAQKQSRIAALQKSKETALANLESGLTSAMSAYAGEEAALKPYYYDLRNRAAAQSDIGAKNFAEFMAAQGIRGSAAGLPEIYRNAALQGQIGALTRQEQQAREDIARRRSATQAEYETQKAGLLNAYESDVAAAMADIDAQTLQNYIDNMRIMQAQRVADLAAQGKTSTGELTLQGRQAQQNELAQQAALLAARYYDDIQAYINTLDPNDPLVPYLYAERRKKIQAQAEQQAAAAAAASEAEQRRWKNAFETFKATGRITSPEQAQILGLPMGATVADVDIARMNAQTSRMNAQTSRMNAQTSAYNAQQKTRQQADQASSQRIKQYADIIDRLYVNTQYDNNGQAIGKTFDPNAVKAYIKNLNQTGQISDDEARQLLGMYGFTF